GSIKGTLTFSNTSGCKGCGQKMCLKHRFPADHGCAGVSPAGAAAARRAGQCGLHWLGLGRRFER
ncbi:hypothetical protein E2562_035945, partial [Oryza meyeriana var. granulata]